MSSETERDVLLHAALSKFDAIVAIVASMNDETANATLPVAGSNSPYALLFHCLGAVRRWSSTVNRGIEIPRDRDAEFVAGGSVAPLLTEAARQRQAFIDDVEAVDLDAPPAAPPEDRVADPQRAIEVATCRAVIVHIIEELAQHLGHLDITRDMLAFLDDARPTASAPRAIAPIPGESGVTNRAKLGIPAARDIPHGFLFTVDDERFTARPDMTQPGAWMIDWLTGPNEGYGFMTRSSDHVWADEDAVRAQARDFLQQIDPATGYLED